MRIAYSQKWKVPANLVAGASPDALPGETEDWRLVTNLAEAFARHAAALYRSRMHPEETHRDSKSGHFVTGFGLQHLGRMRQDRLERYILLWCLIYCFLVLLAETRPAERQHMLRRHQRLSLATFRRDPLHKAGAAAVALVKQACACVKFNPLWVETGDS